MSNVDVSTQDPEDPFPFRVEVGSGSLRIAPFQQVSDA